MAAEEASRLESRPTPQRTGAAPSPPSSRRPALAAARASLYLLSVLAPGLATASGRAAPPPPRSPPQTPHPRRPPPPPHPPPQPLWPRPPSRPVSPASLPPRRALWREAATCAAELALALDASDPSTHALLVACCSAAARTLIIDEGSDDDADEPYSFGAPPATASGPGANAASLEPPHAGAAALCRMCTGSRAVAAALVARDGSIFDGVVRAYQREMSASAGASSGAAMEVQKARLLLRASCALAVASASGTDGGAADERVRLICQPMVAALRATASGDDAASASAPLDS